MNTYSLEELKEKFPLDFEFRGNSDIAYINNVKSITEADAHSLVWCSSARDDKQQLAEHTNARVIICDDSIRLTDSMLQQKGFFIVKNPKLAFARVLRSLTSPELKPGIHGSAVIHPGAQIPESAYIGPNTHIGKCTIGEHSVIHGNAFLYDGTSVGAHVVVEAGAVLGAEGFGFAQAENEKWERLPHIGGLIIQDYAEIGAGTTIDRGTLENTIIGEGTKISKSAHISHNVKIGKNCLVTGGVTIAGSTIIGDNVWISPNATVLNKLSIGNNVFISAGAVVTKNIKDNFQALGRKILPKT